MIARVIRALKLTILLGGGALSFAVAVLSTDLHIELAAALVSAVFGFFFFLEVERPPQ